MSMGGLDKCQESVLILSQKEAKLIETLRKLPFGQAVVFMESNQPVRIEIPRESIKL